MNNPTLTEFCFGMIGRADIEGSKSNVAMNAWLPQASSVVPTVCHEGGRPGHFSAPCGPVDGRTLSGGRSPYLRYPLRWVPTPWRALNRPALYSGSRVGCGSSLFSDLLPACPRAGFDVEVLPPTPWYQRPDESSPHPGVLPWPPPARSGRGPD